MMEPTFLLASYEGTMLAGIAVVGGVVIGLTAMIFTFVRSMYRDRIRGQTQREIAAYVAEGSMTPEEGERLIKAANEPTKERE